MKATEKAEYKAMDVRWALAAILRNVPTQVQSKTTARLKVALALSDLLESWDSKGCTYKPAYMDRLLESVKGLARDAQAGSSYKRSMEELLRVLAS